LAATIEAVETWRPIVAGNPARFEAPSATGCQTTVQKYPRF